MNLYNVEPKNVFLLYEIINQLADGNSLSDILNDDNKGGFHLYRIDEENANVVDLGALGYDPNTAMEKIPRLLFNKPKAVAILYTPDGSIHELDTTRIPTSNSLVDLLK